ncbi:4-hydroxybenzoate octaprenyltransferase [Exilibacterium tricleocarpae]|uniref:4-hydroxybenzoate octaprenyltransferase n=1 Tax=Exilibacterium tricleocarpae TaxID=2591008 RepID=A0A545TZC4_9GAMM|nr:4-hydroxybenzoate octaprenyltransferase [Exilibacterium tricleocarpae]TQV82569.1 4-hydroxybenzoate octaprenyltransferase [Exilibacterium tricleocarpae]
MTAKPSPSSGKRATTAARARRSAARKRPGLLLGYWRLMRFDRPIGMLLLLWPTLWALWFAAEGLPEPGLLGIFVAGVVLMRAAGCVINDFADRHVDGSVKRTRDRPLPSGQVSPAAAVTLFAILCLAAFALVLMTNTLTIQLSFGAVALAFCYPFMKRYTHLPQVVLGAAFSWGIPMAFAAQTGSVAPDAWLVFITAVLWTIVYDTFYGMVDRDDDIAVGVKSTAILFAEHDRLITGCLQGLVLAGLVIVGDKFSMGGFYYLGVALAAVLFGYQQYLIRHREREACFRAFLDNNYVGMAIFAGIVADYASKSLQ